MLFKFNSQLVPHAYATSNTWQVSSDSNDAYVETYSDSPPITNPPWGGIVFDTVILIGETPGMGDCWYFGGGLRWTSIAIPHGATITSAKISLCACYGPGSPNINAHIACEDSDNALTFSTVADYNGRSRTAYVSWSGLGVWSTDEWYNSTDISSCIQTVVNRAGWASGNSLVVFCEDDGTSSDLLSAYDFSGDSSKAAKLYVTWTAPSDTTSPTYSLVAFNETRTGYSCLCSTSWSDNVAVSGFIFGTNNTGHWVNQTWTATSDWGNYTFTLNSTIGQKVLWEEWANDTSNNWNDTGSQTILTASSSTVENSGCACTNLDSGKLLAKYRYYSWSVNVSDTEGYTHIISVDLNFSSSASAYAYGARWNQTTNAWSVIGTSNGTYFWLGTTSSNSSSGTWDNLTFTVMFGWNYPYTSLDAYVVSYDSAANLVATHFTLQYPLVETISGTSPTPSSARANAGGSDSVSGTLQYVGTSVTLPDAEISSVAVHDSGHNSKGAQSGQASYTVSFTLLATIANNAYHISVTGTDANFPNGDVASSTFNVISDSVTITISNSISGRVNINSNATGISATAKYDYDGTAYGGSLTWNDTTFSMSSAVKKYFTVSSISGDTYGITVIRSTNPNSTSVIWDSVTIALSGPSNARINVGANATGISGVATYDYDGAAFGGSLTWNDSTFVMASAVKKYFNVSSISGGTYGITVIRSTNPNSTSEIWDSVTITITNSIDVGPHYGRIDVGANATGISGTAKYDYDSSSYGGTLTWNDTVFTLASVGKKYFMVNSVSGDSYGITVIRSMNPNNTNVVWDRVNFTLVANATSLAYGETVLINATARSTYYTNLLYHWSFNLLRNGTHFVSGNSTDFSNCTDSGSGVTYQYTIENVTETDYGLTVFTSNTVTVTWSGPIYWTLTTVDVDGNALPSVTINISRNGAILYSNATTPWVQIVPANTYNVSVYWLQNLLVNTTLNVNIAGSTATSLTCLCYPYTIGGTRYWIATNSTINSTSTTTDSITANQIAYIENFDSLNNWFSFTPVLNPPEINPPSQLQLFSQAPTDKCGVETILAHRGFYSGLPSQYTVEFRLKIDQFGTPEGWVEIEIFDDTYCIPFGIFSNHISVGTSGSFTNFTLATDNNWHNWTLVCDHTTTTFSIYRDGILITSMAYVSTSTSAGIDLDCFGGTGTSTLAHFDWIQIYSGLVVPNPNYVLVASCPTFPTYILGVAYDKTACFDPYGYLVISFSSTPAITISYVDWGGLSVPMTDHPLTSVTPMSYGDLGVILSGSTGDFGHIQIDCGGKGNPWDAGGLTISYGSQTLTGTYTFTADLMPFIIRWYSASLPSSPTNPQRGSPLPNLPTNLFVNVVYSFPTYAQPGTIVNGTLNVTWSGYSTIYLWSVSLNTGYRNWTLNMPSLPLLLQGFDKTSATGLDGAVSIPVTLTVPAGAELNGTQQIPCTVTVQTSGGSGKAIRAYISLDLVGLSAQIPDVMTYGFVALVVGALITMPIFMRSNSKKKKQKK